MRSRHLAARVRNGTTQQGRQIERKTAESRQAIGGSDPAGGARYILTGYRVKSHRDDRAAAEDVQTHQPGRLRAPPRRSYQAGWPRRTSRVDGLPGSPGFLHGFYMVPRWNRYSMASEWKTSQDPGGKGNHQHRSCGSTRHIHHYLRIDRESSSHPPHDRSGGRHRPALRRRRIRVHASPRALVWPARVRLR